LHIRLLRLQHARILTSPSSREQVLTLCLGIESQLSRRLWTMQSQFTHIAGYQRKQPCRTCDPRPVRCHMETGPSALLTSH